MRVPTGQLTRRQSFALIAGLFFLTGCASIDASIEAVLRDLPICMEIAKAILVIINTVTNVNAGVEERIETAVGNITSALEMLQVILKQYREGIDKGSITAINIIDAAVAAIYNNLNDILRAVQVYDVKIIAAVGWAVSSIQMVLLGIAALVPRAMANQFPRTMVVMQSQNRVLGAIRAEIPGPRHLAELYNKGEKDFPQAKVSVPRKWGLLPL